jgi:hypothetical protein
MALTFEAVACLLCCSQKRSEAGRGSEETFDPLRFNSIVVFDQSQTKVDTGPVSPMFPGCVTKILLDK